MQLNQGTVTTEPEKCSRRASTQSYGNTEEHLPGPSWKSQGGLHRGSDIRAESWRMNKSWPGKERTRKAHAKGRSGVTPWRIQGTERSRAQIKSKVEGRKKRQQ